MRIQKDGKRQLSPNFHEWEFYLGYVTRGATSLRPESHFLDNRLIEAVQLIRDFFNTPVLINSTFRPHKTKGYHPKGMALDFSFQNSNKDLISAYSWEISKRRELFYKLRAIGINGFGIYDSFGHIDTRQEKGMHVDQNGNYYALWDSTILNAPSPLGETAVNTAAIGRVFSSNQNEEDLNYFSLVRILILSAILMKI